MSIKMIGGLPDGRIVTTIATRGLEPTLATAGPCFSAANPMKNSTFGNVSRMCRTYASGDVTLNRAWIPPLYLTWD